MFFKKRSYLNFMFSDKLFLFMAIIIMLIILLAYFSNTIIYKERTMKQSKEYNSEIINQIIINTDSYYNLLDNIAHSLMFNNTTQLALSSNKKTEAELSRERKYMIESIRLFDYSRKEITISLFSLDDPTKWYTSSPTEFEYDFTKEGWYQSIMKTDEKKIIILNNTQNYRNANEKKVVHSLIYKIWDNYTFEHIGFLNIDIDTSYFKEFYNEWPSYAEGICIFKSNGEIIYEKKINNNLIFNNLWTILAKNKTGITSLSKSQDIIWETSDVTDWKFVHVLSNSELMSEINKVNTIFLSIYVGFLVLLLFFSYLFSKKLTKPLLELTDGMHQIKQGNFNVYQKIYADDEIGILTRTFNSMTQRISQLVNSAKTRESILKETEFKALQQQINPHFLYNTLEMISGMALCNENENIVLVSKQLADMFRYNLASSKYVNLNEEIMQIKNYISIMQFRYSKNFKAKFFIENELDHCKIPRFILQPFVENSINHGFIAQDKDYQILISIHSKDNILEIIIEDNGKGISKGELETINSSLLQQKTTPDLYYDSNTHIGIANVHLRLILLYPNNYVFSIKSNDEIGTKIFIAIPMNGDL